ncbi:hypothetical protein JCM10213_002677 [Rhodosporidiobolus nylandii]
MRGFSDSPAPHSPTTPASAAPAPDGDAPSPATVEGLDGRNSPQRDRRASDTRMEDVAQDGQLAGGANGRSDVGKTQNGGGRWEHDRADDNEGRARGRSPDDRWARRDRSRSRERGGRGERYSSEWRPSGAVRERSPIDVDAPSAPLSTENNIRYVLTLPFTNVGGPIIGRSGATQKRIRRESPLHVLRVHQGRGSVRGGGVEEPQVELVGTPEGVQKALRMIEAAVYSQDERWDEGARRRLDESRDWVTWDERKAEKVQPDEYVDERGALRYNGNGGRSAEMDSPRSSRRRSPSPSRRRSFSPRRGRSPSPSRSRRDRSSSRGPVPRGAIRRDSPPPADRTVYRYTTTFPVRKIGGLFNGPEGRTAQRLIDVSGLLHFEVRRTQALHAVGVLLGSKPAIRRALETMEIATYREAGGAWNDWEQNKLSNRRWCEFNDRECMVERGIWLEEEADDKLPPGALRDGEQFLLNTSRNALDFADQDLPLAPGEVPYAARGGDVKGPRFGRRGGGGQGWGQGYGGDDDRRSGYDDRRPPPPQRPGAAGDDRWGGRGGDDRWAGRGGGGGGRFESDSGWGSMRRGVKRDRSYSPARRSRSPVRRRTRSPPRYSGRDRGRSRSRSPVRRRSPSRSRSPVRRRSPSVGRRRSPSPRRGRSPSVSSSRSRSRMEVDEERDAKAGGASGNTVKEIPIPPEAAAKFLPPSASLSFIEDATSCTCVLQSSRKLGGSVLRIEGPGAAVEQAITDVERVVVKVVEGWKAPRE